MKLTKRAHIGSLEINSDFTNTSATISCYIDLTNKEEEKKLMNMVEGTVKITLEKEEPILDNAERKYLSEVIRPFRGRVDYIQKNIHSQREFISIALNGEIIAFPFFKKGAMYKGMQLNKEYTLKELGL